MTYPIFSIIIPAYNEAANIGLCLESVFSCVREGFSIEVIVVDDCSTDDTAEIARAYGCKVIPNQGSRDTISGLRNIGAQMANGEFFVFLDADMVVPSNWLTVALSYFENDFKGLFGFVDRVPDEAGMVAKAWGNRLFIKRDRIMDVDFLTGRNLFLNKTVFSALNGFDEKLSTAEDKDFSLRAAAAGYRVFSSPEAPVVHLGYEKNLREFIIKEYWRQGGALDLALKGDISPRTLRQPMICLWHLLASAAFTLSLFFGGAAAVIIFLILWLTPAVLKTRLDLGSKASVAMNLQVFFLTFLRWHIAAVSLIVRAWELAGKKQDLSSEPVEGTRPPQ